MTIFAYVVDSSSDVSSDGLNTNHKFWSKSIMEDTTSPEPSDNSRRNINHTTTVVTIADEPSTTTTTTKTSYEYTIADASTSTEEQQQPRPRINRTTSTNLTVFNATSITGTDSTKRYQTKMLLASLIEHFCRAYGDTPDANRKVFFLICQTLRSLGIIDAEFVDEMTSVRSSFQQAFHKLFYTAVQTVRNQDLVQFDDNLPRLIKPSVVEDEFGTDMSYTSSSSSSSGNSSEPSYSTSHNDPKPRPILRGKHHKNDVQQDYFSSHASSSAGAGTSFTTLNNFSPQGSSKLSSSSTTLHSFVHGGDFFHNLSIQNSRYNNDFVEISLLGKGGFASAFRARNKLDGIDYAVKKIRLGNDIIEESDDRHKENPYEKIFREIKNLARLEHVNVIRYYSSWLEFDDDSNNNNQLATDGSDWEDDTSRRNSKFTDESSVFEGRDPTFDNDDSVSSSLGNYYGYPPSESGMSHIQFGDSSGGYEAGGNDTSSALSVSSKRKKTPSPVVPQQQSGWTLFIQMQLCPTTLHDYIKFRNKQYSETSSYGQHVDTNRNIEIFSQILQGTAYIHDQGLIHRDLKPSNIFLSMPNASAYMHDNSGRRRRVSSASSGCLESMTSCSIGGGASYRSSYDAVVSENGLRECMWEESWVPKIGDFGLAAEAMDEGGEGGGGDAVLVPTPKLQSQVSSTSVTTDDGVDVTLVNKLKNNNTDHGGRPKRPKPRRTRTVGVGTRTYASPEQLAIPAQPYDEKVDIYSLGIILFELFQPFATGMERADSLDKLKRGVFPDGFLELYPKVSALIIWMMDEKPDHRPTAHQLLEFELFSHPEDVDIYATLQQQLQKKSSIIEELKKTVERVELEKQQALSEMQQRLDEMQLQLDRLQNGSVEVAPSTTPNTTNAGLKKCLLTQSPSFLMKKKKEVRWSTLNTDFK